ncbi:hypothetical protein PTKIN_Ptkin05aG0013300 [Pterospermum kingtungense]
MEPRQVQGPAATVGRLQGQQPQQQMVMGPTSSSYRSNSAMISPNPTPNFPPGFPFNSLASPPPQPPPHHQPQPKPLDSLSSVGGFDGSPQFYNTEPAMKKKRGRPRKYAADDGNISLLQLAPNSTPVVSTSANHENGDFFGLASSGGGGGGGDAASEPLPKKNRGRPPSSGKRQIDALGGFGGVGFTPHVITVQTGEDIASNIMAFARQGPRAICILSANGAVCNVTLRQPAISGGTVTYEGQFEIISLSGSFLLSDDNSSHSRAAGLSVSLAGSDGRVLGGGVAGLLQAASPVQVIVGSFIADRKKQNSDVFKTGPSSIRMPNMMNFEAPGTTDSPPSQDGSSESSDENEDNPLNRGSHFYGSSAPSIHNNNMPMYPPLWTGHIPR